MTVDTLPMLVPAPPKPNKILAAINFYLFVPNRTSYAIIAAINFFFFCFCVRLIIILPGLGIPSPPIFHLHSLSINVSRIPLFNVTSSQDIVIIRWNVSFDVRNPYKYVKIIHDQANVSVFYKKVNLSTAVISPFYQYELGEDQRSLEKAALFVANDDILAAGDWSKNGAVVNFTVSIDDAVSLISPPYAYFPINLDTRFICEDVPIIFSSDKVTNINTTTTGTSMLSDHSKQCKIQYNNQVFKYSSIWHKPSFPPRS